MKRALLVCVILAAAGASTAEGNVTRAPVRIWNPETVATLTGTVETIDPIVMGYGLSALRLQLKTSEGLVRVRIGPSWWVAEKKIAFTKGETLEVKGSRLVFAGEPSIVAAEIRRGGDRLVLRDAAGKPAWLNR
jgi:hypothetical protein